MAKDLLDPTAQDDNPDNINPERNAGQQDYNDKFNTITNTPENQAFGDQTNASAQDGFKYSPDSDRQDLATNEALGGTTVSSQEEVDKLRSASDSDLYNPTKDPVRKRWGFGSLNQRVGVGLIGGGLITFIIAILGGVSSGFGEFLHLDFALGRTSRVGSMAVDIRTHGFSRMARAYSSGDVGETRVGYIGSRRFNTIMNRLENGHGITFDRRDATGRPTRMRIQPPENSLLWDADAEKMDAKINRYLAQTDGINVHCSSGCGPGGTRVYGAVLSGRSASQLRPLMDSVVKLDNSTANKVRGTTIIAMRKRVIGKFWNAPSLFNPINRAASNVDEKVRTRIDKSRRERERKNRSGKKATLSQKVQGKVNSARGSISPGAVQSAGAALSFTGGLCMLHEISALIPALNYASIQQPSMEEAIDKKAVASQMRDGNNFDADQASDIASNFRDEGGGTIWGSKALDASLNGGAGSGSEVDPALHQAYSMRGSNISDLVRLLAEGSDDNDLISAATSGGDAFADAACSGPGYVVQLAAGGALTLFAPGGVALKSVQAAQGMAVMAAITSIFGDLVEGRAEESARGFCGQDENAVVTDAEKYGGCLIYGARGAENINLASMGGVELSNTQQRVLGQELDKKEISELHKKSFAARFFDINEPRSLVASAFKKLHNVHDTRSLAYAVSQTTANVTNNTLSLLTPVAYAQEEQYDWGFPLISVPLEILNDQRYDDPYHNSKLAAGIFSSGHTIDKARVCFGTDIKQVEGRWQAEVVEEVMPNENEYVDANCDDLSNEDWVRTMLYVFDDAIVTTGDCYDADGGSSSCQEIGFGNSSGDDTSQDTPGIGPLPDGLVDISETVVPDVCGGSARVHQSIAASVASMCQAAAQDGTPLTIGNSFRDYQHQVRLRQQNCGTSHYAVYEMPSSACRPPTAPPGRSQHQRGLAMDFSNCSSRSTACYRWLAANAERFGFFNLPSEPWHWSVNGN